jgi:hypothetical protein
VGDHLGQVAGALARLNRALAVGSRLTINKEGGG